MFIRFFRVSVVLLLENLRCVVSNMFLIFQKIVRSKSSFLNNKSKAFLNLRPVPKAEALDSISRQSQVIENNTNIKLLANQKIKT